MNQQPMPQPRDEYERQSSTYENYVGDLQHNEGYRANPQENEGYRGNPQANDPLVESIVQRLRYEFRFGMKSSTAASSNQRLALAIVSIVMLVPLTAIILGTSSFAGWISPLVLIMVFLGIFGINFLFNIRG